MNFKSYQDLSQDIFRNIHLLHKYNFDLVVGIPRSGMIPAYIISSLLNINCTDLTSFTANIALKHGQTRKLSKLGDTVIFPSDAKAILLVDDSINSGISLANEKKLLKNTDSERITSLAIYSSLPNRNDVDLVFEYVPNPRAFEWNIFHHDILGEACVDIDGILCINPNTEENDNELQHLTFLEKAPPLIIPSKKIFALVTSRPEKYRKETELWLRNNGISWEHLIMLDLPSKKERLCIEVHTQHKASYYKNSPTCIFLESDNNQAKEISILSEKVVYCTESGVLYIEGKASDTVYHKKYFYNGHALRLDQLIPLRIGLQFSRWILKYSALLSFNTSSKRQKKRQ